MVAALAFVDQPGVHLSPVCSTLSSESNQPLLLEDRQLLQGNWKWHSNSDEAGSACLRAVLYLLHTILRAL